MRRRLRSSSRIAVLLVTLLAAGTVAADGPKEVDDGIDVWFRDVDLSATSDQDLEVYGDADAGESKRLPRAFPDAPPQISHTVEDMLPITADSNDCLDCHHPTNAVGKEDLPLPETHFERPVMSKGKPGESMVWVVRGYEKAKDVVGSRYECTMCHAPQATNVETPDSRFVGVEAPPSK